MVRRLKKGGNLRYVITSAVSGDTFVVPAGFRIDLIQTKNVNVDTGTLSLGTAAAGTQIVNAGSLGAADAIVKHTIVAKFFSRTTDQTVYITPSTTGEFTLYVQMQKID